MRCADRQSPSSACCPQRRERYQVLSRSRSWFASRRIRLFRSTANLAFAAGRMFTVRRTASANRRRFVLFPSSKKPFNRSENGLFLRVPFSARTLAFERPRWVKLRRSQYEHMFSALPPNSDIARWQLAFRIRANRRLMHRSKQALYSTTSSTRASSAGGTARPSALAVLRLIARSNFVGCWTGRSAGFSPWNIRST